MTDDIKEEKDHESGIDTREDDDDNADFTPTTVVVMLGSMNFEPVTSVDILSLKIQNLEERSEVLEKASKDVKSNSLESLHILLKSSSVSTLFDESIFTTFFDAIIPGKEVVVHVLPESAALAEDMAVQAGDVDSIRMGIVMSGLLLQVEQEHEGCWILTATKPGGADETSDEEDAEEGITDAEKQEEEEFRKLIDKELDNCGSGEDRT